jgi:hypothetical protein
MTAHRHAVLYRAETLATGQWQTVMLLLTYYRKISVYWGVPLDEHSIDDGELYRQQILYLRWTNHRAKEPIVIARALTSVKGFFD